MPSFTVRNFGCRVNLAESLAWVEAFRRRGLRFEEDWRRSDVVIVNSCTLTGRADRDVRKAVRMFGRENPGARLVVTGCLAERSPGAFEGLPGIALVLGNKAKPELVGRVLALLSESRSGELSERPAEEMSPKGRAVRGGGDDREGSFRARGYLKVQDGCDKRCAFCVIPSVRGPGVSVTPKEALAGVESLVGQGYREIVLAGIDLSSYGDDLESRITLAGLLREIVEVPGLGRVRLSSLDPGRVDKALVGLVAAGGKVCRHFHLSLQHASARILRLMGRAADPEMYRRLLTALRGAASGAAIGADVIVGFPGETEEDYGELERFLEDSPLSYFPVFSYSPRKGTPAAGRRQVSDKAITERSAALRRLSAAKSLVFRRSFEGRTLAAAVIDQGGGPEAARAELLTDNYIKVETPPSPAPRRELVRVRVTRVSERSTEGEFVV
jgi:threonylcarbamoyladenosine tRNA methylthiotransferase MtaB